MKLYFVLSSNKFIAAISSIFKIKYKKLPPKHQILCLYGRLVIAARTIETQRLLYLFWKE